MTTTTPEAARASEQIKALIGDSRLNALKAADELASKVARGEIEVCPDTTAMIERTIRAAEMTWQEFQAEVARHERIIECQRQLSHQRQMEREKFVPMRVQRDQLRAELSALREEVKRKQARVDEITASLTIATTQTGLSRAEDQLRKELLPPHIHAELAEIKAALQELTPRRQEIERRLLKNPGNTDAQREHAELIEQANAIEQREQALKATYLPVEIVAEREQYRKVQSVASTRHNVLQRMEKITRSIAALEKRRPNLVDQRKTFATMPQQLSELETEIEELDNELESLRKEREAAQRELDQIDGKPASRESDTARQPQSQQRSRSELSAKAVRRMNLPALQEAAQQLDIPHDDETTAKELRAAIIEYIEHRPESE